MVTKTPLVTSMTRLGHQPGGTPESQSARHERARTCLAYSAWMYVCTNTCTRGRPFDLLVEGGAGPIDQASANAARPCQSAAVQGRTDGERVGRAGGRAGGQECMRRSVRVHACVDASMPHHTMLPWAVLLHRCTAAFKSMNACKHACMCSYIPAVGYPAPY